MTYKEELQEFIEKHLKLLEEDLKELGIEDNDLKYSTTIH